MNILTFYGGKMPFIDEKALFKSKYPQITVYLNKILIVINRLESDNYIKVGYFPIQFKPKRNRKTSYFN